MIGVDVQVDSNAGYRKVDFWKELADLDVYVNFAVDGLEDTNKIYRKNVEWKTVISNMKAFAAAGGKGRWNFIVFKHNEHQVEEARKIAEDLGLDFRVKITQKFRRAKVWDVMINGSKAYEIKPPTDTKYRHSNISDKPYSISYPPMAKNLSDVEIDCKALKNREIFLSYQGLVLPCCYLGSIHGQSPASQQLASLDLSPYDLSKHSLDEILVNLNQISDSWNNTIDDGRLIMCAQTCAKSRQQHTLYE
jgi:MoaA/NifB/PqqE/SkfB family radical SAM enzyme